jgi:RES domain-containing protein
VVFTSDFQSIIVINQSSFVKFYRITACTYANDLSGEGAFLYGGRWNSKGTRLLYTAENPALAYLEALAHMMMVNQKRDYCKLRLELNTKFFKEFAENAIGSLPKSWFSEIAETALPANWRATSAPFQLKKIGDDFAKEGKFIALKVPSVIEPESFNYLFNPLHPFFKSLLLLNSEKITLDQRLL